MSRDPSDDNERLPPWLRDVPLPPRPAGRDAPFLGTQPAAQRSDRVPPPADESAGVPDWLRGESAAPAAGATADDSTIPDWLRGGGEPATAGEEPVPDWLRTEPAGRTSGEEPVPDWLRTEPAAPGPAAGEAPVPSWLSGEQAGGTASEEPVPSWLSGEVTAPGGATQDESAIPDWLRGTETPAAGRSADTAGLPDWLHESQPSDQPPASREPESLPSWLNDMAQPEAPSGDTADVDDQPSWLRDLAGEAPAAGSTQSGPPANTSVGGGSAPVAPLADDSDTAGIPDWLRDIPADEIRRVMEEDVEEGITAEPFSFEGATPPAQPQPTQPQPTPGLPAWLADAPGESAGGAEGMPSWLEEPAPETPAPSGATSELADVPLWLQDLDSTPSSGAPTATPWLDEPPAQEPAGMAAPTLPKADDVPAWLSDIEQSGGGPAGDVPAWLQDSGPAASAPADVPAWLQDSGPATALPAADEVPPWLRDIEQPGEAPAGDVPLWLQDSGPAAAPPADVPPPPPAPGADLPDWLRASQANRAAGPASGGPPAADDLPDWLRPSEPAGPPPPPAVPPVAGPPAPAAPPAEDTSWIRPAAGPPAPATPAAGDLPPWLRDESGQPLPTAGAPGETNLPEWLRGAPIEPARPEVEARLPATPSSTRPLGADWFDDVPARPPERAPGAGENEFFGGADLPAWLRVPEPEPPPEMSPADARSLDWLTRLGALEDEGNTAVAAPSPRLAPPSAPVRTAAQIEALALLERLAADPFPEAVPLPAPAPASILRRIGLERTLYWALLIGVLLALLIPLQDFGLQVPPAAPGTDQLFAQIDALTENDVVLVGYEWDARRISEMLPLEQAVIKHLLQKKVKLVLISTDPQGTLLLFDLRDQLVAANYLPAGQDYILLGYKPGGELALRSLAQDFHAALRSDFQGTDASEGLLATGAQTGKPLTTLNDLSMILVLADDASDVQGWMEQIHSSVPEKPLGFLLPAETTPLVQPYLRQPQIFYLAGKPGALAYEHQLGPDSAATEQVARQAGQQRASILVFILLLVVSATGVIVSRSAARRRGAE